MAKLANKKIICFGVIDTELPFYDLENKKFGFDIVLVKEQLTKDNVNLIKGCEAIVVRTASDCSAANLERMKANGLKYLITKSAGFNHIDLNKAKELNIRVANVPAYSPTAISELVVSAGFAMLRNVYYMSEQTCNHNFKLDDGMFAKEVSNSVIGVIGTGRIGYEAAKAWKGLGAKVLGYDIYPNEKCKEVLEYVNLDTLAAQSDLITIHAPYIKGQNDHMINAEFIAKMKDNAVLVNGARGPIVDSKAVYDALISKKLKGHVMDVYENELGIFGKNFDGKSTGDELFDKLIALYPRVVVTPHVGFYTDKAVSNMIEYSYQNCYDFMTGENCKNEIK